MLSPSPTFERVFSLSFSRVLDLKGLAFLSKNVNVPERVFLSNELFEQEPLNNSCTKWCCPTYVDLNSALATTTYVQCSFNCSISFHDLVHFSPILRKWKELPKRVVSFMENQPNGLVQWLKSTSGPISCATTQSRTLVANQRLQLLSMVAAAPIVATQLM